MFTPRSARGAFMLHIFSFVLLIHSTLQELEGKVGIAFAPFVRDEDQPSSTFYTKQDVKVMLELVLEQGFQEIATYGVGAPNEPYAVNSTSKKCSSVVHTALAAADINKDRRRLSLSIYEGIFSYPNEPHRSSEIEVGFEVAREANKLYNGTVSAIVFPSITGIDTLFEGNTPEEITKLSGRTRDMKMKFGLRLWNCDAISSRVGNEANKRVLANYNLIICQRLANQNSYASGVERYVKTITKEFEAVKKALADAGLQGIELVLDSGWPGVADDPKSVKSMFQFWKLLKDWAMKTKTHVILQEAFNNPWKNTHPDLVSSVYLGGHFGIFAHSQDDSTSKSSYKLKEERSDQTDKGLEDSRGVSSELIIGIVFGSVLFILVIIMVVFLHRRVARINANSKLTEEDIRQFRYGIVTNQVVDEKGGTDAWNRIPYNRDFELKKNKFFIDKTILLGSGQFGSVYKGKIEGLLKDVAFKMTRPDCPLTALKGLLSEIKILTYLGMHENIVSICGAYTAELPNGIAYLATELCPRGSLEKHLRSMKSNYTNVPRYTPSPNDGLNSGTISDLQLLRWSLDIASAMEFISSKNVIHADLATRNVLLTADMTARVTDFGLSRRLYEYTEYVKQQQEPLPWRWMALESLKQLEFSTKSDVWSYGVTLWEIFSMGDVPYPGLTWNLSFVNELEGGLRMQRPSKAPINIFEIMVQCWNSDPSQRPTFEMMKKLLHSFHLQSPTHEARN